MKRSIFLIVLSAVLAAVLMEAAVFADADDPAAGSDPVVSNGLPVVTVTIDESKGTIEAMNKSENHSVSCEGTFRIDVPAVQGGFRYSDFPDTVCQSLGETKMEIRGRGNSTWGADKKPYKVKLGKKKDTPPNVLGLGENRHWVLLANAYDKTLIKDRITAWLGDAFGMEFTPRGVPVDLVMKNTEGTYSKYLGSYYLSENVRIDKNRVEIHELKEADTVPEDITGGYLLQGGMQVDDNSPNKFFTKAGLDLANKSPDFDVANDGDYENEAQMNYIRKYMQDVEDALFSGNFDGKDGTSYRDMMDLESAAKYWLIDQASCNSDGYVTGSTYYYKREDTVTEEGTVPGKLYWGPLWDFDYAWYYEEEPDGYTGFRLKHEWLKPMMYDIGSGGFVQEVRKQWPAAKAALEELTRDGGVIDKYFEETKASQAADLIANPVKDEDLDGKPDTYVYEDEITALKAWIVKRTAWLDKHIMRTHDLESLVHKITLEADGREVREFYASGEDGFYGLGEAPDKDGYTFICWLKEDGEPVSGDEEITKDMTLTAKYLPDEEVTHATTLFIRQSIVYLDVKEIYTREMAIPYTVLPKNAQDRKVYWESSNEEVASVNDEGTLEAHKTGTATITGRLKSGEVKTITVIVTDGGVEELTGIKVTPKEIKLKKGQYKKIDIINTPENSQLFFLDMSSSNEKVVTVDQTGVLYGRKTGSATINIESVAEDPVSGRSIDLYAKCKVYVTGPNTMKVKGKTVKISRSAVENKTKKIKRAKAITVKKAVGKVTYKLTGVTKKKYGKYFSVAKKTGKLTVKKGLKKGTYKLRIKVKAAGDKAFKAKSKTVTVKVRII